MTVFLNPTAYLSATNVVDNVPGWPKGLTRHYGYAKTLTCEQALAAFLALTLPQMLSATTTTIPTPPTGTAWQRRTCPGSSTGDVITDWEDEADTVVLPTDGSAWSEGNPNDVDDQNAPVTYSEPVILTDV